MKACHSKILCICIISILGITGLLFSASLNSDTLKIVTFNIYGAPDSDWEIRERLILEELAVLQPDIIGLQEVVQNPYPGIGPDNRAKVLADSLYFRTGVRYDFRFLYTQLGWNVYDQGNAILSRHIILETDSLVLPPGLFSRKVMYTRILSPAGIVDMFNTHLAFGEQEATRILQVQALKPFIDLKNNDGVAVSSIISGDFNSAPDRPPILLMTQPDTNGTFYLDSWAVANPGLPGFTIPSNNPDTRIDYLFMRASQSGEIVNSQLILDLPDTNNIYPSDHIGVLSRFRTAVNKVDLNIISPQAGAILSGQANISWSIGTTTEPLDFQLYISRDAGKSWWREWSGTNLTYSWNTLQVPDGTRYLLQIAAVGDSSFGLVKSSGRFTVNNPGNVPPEIELFSPRGNENWSGTKSVRWLAADADGDPLAVFLDISTDDGTSWESLAANLPNDSLYFWNTPQYSNSPYYRLRLRVSDGIHEVSEISGQFEIDNPRIPLSGAMFQHISGTGSAILNALVVNQSQITGHVYRITFNDTLSAIKTYDVEDVNTGVVVVSNATQLDGSTEGPYFDGLRLVIRDFDPAEVNEDSTGWSIGSSSLHIDIFLPSINIGGTLYQGYAYPADYRITIFDQIMDTSSSAFGAPPVPMKFTIWNETENRRTETIFLDSDNNNSISRGDLLYLLDVDSLAQPQFIWAISFGGPLTVTPPVAGDIYDLITLKPLTYLDIYTFNSTVFLRDNKEVIRGDFQLLQNFPNPFNPVTNIEFFLPRSSHATLKIYNILGEEVASLLSASLLSGSHSVEWDASDFASGIYLYRFEANGYAMTRKMIILK